MSEVLLEKPVPRVALLRLNRPQARNALDLPTRKLLAEHFRSLSDDGETRCIVIAGGEKVFAAGADMRELVEAGPIEVMARRTKELWAPIVGCPVPIIAAVTGMALGGGCELALHADIIVAGESATFGQPEVKVGVMPGSGATQRLIRTIGKYKAMKMVLTGQSVPAAEAERMGMVSEVVADDQVLIRAVELATLIASMPPLAIAQIKEVMLAGADAPLHVGLALELRANQLMFASRDQKEGMRAFLEKRTPKFEGK